MSVDLQWDKLTSGPDGLRRAERIRSFVHDKFQNIPFPKFIKSVQVHSFSFGTIAPDIEIKDICDPYPEFYEQDDEETDSESDSVDGHDEVYLLKLERELRRRERKLEGSNNTNNINTTSPPPQSSGSTTSRPPPPYSVDTPSRQGPILHSHSHFRTTALSGIPDSFPGRVGVTGVTTPLFSPMPGGSAPSSNLHYFHSALSPGFSAPQSPVLHRTTPSLTSLRANFPDLSHHPHTGTSTPRSDLLATALGASTAASVRSSQVGSEDSHDSDDRESDTCQSFAPNSSRLYQPRDEDTQILARIRYSGDVRLELTAELLFEYPVANFVGLPVRLVVTGCTFDGLACVAYIRRRAHFCFLDKDPEKEEEREKGEGRVGGAVGGLQGRSLLKEIRVESEIGEKGKGKQVLKNVGKVERFVLEQVRRIFEEEFVFPSSWTFLV